MDRIRSGSNGITPSVTGYEAPAPRAAQDALRDAATAEVRALRVGDGVVDDLLARMPSEPLRNAQLAAFAEAQTIDFRICALREELGRLQAGERVKDLAVRPPAPVLAMAQVGAVAIPIAETVDLLAKLVPYAGALLAAEEAAVGRGLGGLGAPLETHERVAEAALLALPAAGAVLKGGASGARAVLALAARTGRPTERVLQDLRALAGLERDQAALSEARALLRAGQPLQPRHTAALERARRTLVELGGAAQDTRFRGIDNTAVVRDPDKVTYGAWRSNPGGTVRTVAEATAIARRHGVDLPEWMKIVVDPSLNSDAKFAEYQLSRVARRGGELVDWKDLAPEGTVVVRVRPDVFQSDEAIVGVLAHEAHELTNLQRMTCDAKVAARDVKTHVVQGRRGNLHDQAWDIGDLHVRVMRADSPEQRATLRLHLDHMRARFEVQNFGY